MILKSKSYSKVTWGMSILKAPSQQVYCFSYYPSQARVCSRYVEQNGYRLELGFRIQVFITVNFYQVGHHNPFIGPWLNILANDGKL